MNDSLSKLNIEEILNGFYWSSKSDIDAIVHENTQVRVVGVLLV